MNQPLWIKGFGDLQQGEGSSTIHQVNAFPGLFTLFLPSLQRYIFIRDDLQPPFHIEPVFVLSRRKSGGSVPVTAILKPFNPCPLFLCLQPENHRSQSQKSKERYQASDPCGQRPPRFNMFFPHAHYMLQMFYRCYYERQNSNSDH